MASLLAVDLGLRTGLALYDGSGRGGTARLVWARSHNFGTAGRLRRGVYGMLNDVPDPAWLIIEGGGPLAEPWRKEARRRSIAVRQVSAETWRRTLLLPRERRTGAAAKQNAETLARAVMAWSDVTPPRTLRHDAAEAILIGLWGLLQVGWLEEVPEELRR